MATVRSIDGSIGLGRREFPVRRLLAGVTTYLNAIRDGNAAAGDYDRLVHSGISHEDAVKRIFADHFRG